MIQKSFKEFVWPLALVFSYLAFVIFVVQDTGTCEVFLREYEKNQQNFSVAGFNLKPLFCPKDDAVQENLNYLSEKYSHLSISGKSSNISHTAKLTSYALADHAIFLMSYGMVIFMFNKVPENNLHYFTFVSMIYSAFFTCQVISKELINFGPFSFMISFATVLIFGTATLFLQYTLGRM